jgi:hypothetical protein
MQRQMEKDTFVWAAVESTCAGLFAVIAIFQLKRVQDVRTPCSFSLLYPATLHMQFWGICPTTVFWLILPFVFMICSTVIYSQEEWLSDADMSNSSARDPNSTLSVLFVWAASIFFDNHRVRAVEKVQLSSACLLGLVLTLAPLLVDSTSPDTVHVSNRAKFLRRKPLFNCG